MSAPSMNSSEPPTVLRQRMVQSRAFLQRIPVFLQEVSLYSWFSISLLLYISASLALLCVAVTHKEPDDTGGLVVVTFLWASGGNVLNLMTHYRHGKLGLWTSEQKRYTSPQTSEELRNLRCVYLMQDGFDIFTAAVTSVVCILFGGMIGAIGTGPWKFNGCISKGCSVEVTWSILTGVAYFLSFLLLVVHWREQRVEYRQKMSELKEIEDAAQTEEGGAQSKKSHQGAGAFPSRLPPCPTPPHLLPGPVAAQEVEEAQAAEQEQEDEPRAELSDGQEEGKKDEATSSCPDESRRSVEEERAQEDDSISIPPSESEQAGEESCLDTSRAHDEKGSAEIGLKPIMSSRVFAPPPRLTVRPPSVSVSDRIHPEVNNKTIQIPPAAVVVQKPKPCEVRQPGSDNLSSIVFIDTPRSDDLQPLYSSSQGDGCDEETAPVSLTETASLPGKEWVLCPPGRTGKMKGKGKETL
uniref:Uncharacterized protein n=1 Tax=Chromera velia CCMP2878 TaxID=1169474 RepID=A0A0G4G7X1_9ALVE|eukprot:Cvel_4272.t1-p1 / transcript=Cvel_4272.t1 / gene=Cvel_4272 / organism=Chromera_velia_CCMP2878 / gene_product=hypothetical protein / transcript_product=hypothetical protein / location=Cvel_scaffold185:32339-36046(-) / protein_length=466 / sequence_SO=supercontig / SO=protein_coding / is_pseudo=false